MYRDNILEIKEKFKKIKDNKDKKNSKDINDYKDLQNSLKKLYIKEKYGKKEYINIVKFSTENQNELKEFRDFFLKRKKDNENEKKENIEKEEKKENDESDTNVDIPKKIEEEKKEEINNNNENKENSIKENEETKNFFKLAECMKKFPDKLNKNKEISVLKKATEAWMKALIASKTKEEEEEEKINKKNNYSYKSNGQKLSKEEKVKILYTSICNLYDEGNFSKLFSKLNSIPLEYLNEKEKNKLINMSIQIYCDLTNSQKDKIKKKYSNGENKNILDFLFLDSENILKNNNKAIESLSCFIEDYSKKKENNENNNTKINENNCDDILLNIYRELMHYKYKKIPLEEVNIEKKKKKHDEINLLYILQNKDNIQEKIYFFLIINFINYKDQFIKGNNLIPFLYIKKYYEYNDFEKFLNEKDIIKELINTYSEENLKEEEIKEKSYFDENKEESDNDEETLSSYETDKLLINNLLKFIPEKYLKLYSIVIKKINNFYKIPFPINSLVNYDNINFTFNIIDLVLFYDKYSGNNEINEKEGNDKEKKKEAKKDFVKKYIRNLKKLEKDIFDYYKRSTLDYVEYEEDDNCKKFTGFKINQKMKEVYKQLKDELNYKLENSLNFYNEYQIKYIPFGSITQFLSGENGDIDLFLDIRRTAKKKISFEDINKNKTEILQKLRKILTKMDKDISFHQTNRLCLFTITYQGVKIDINVYGICSYYGEILLREYALLDFRFPMLVIYLKNIISKKKIKNSENEKIFINSFAWTNILLTFLQDILDPPLFPRLLTEDNKKQIKIKVGGGKGKDKKKELEDEFECQKVRMFDVIKEPKNMKKVEEKFYGKKEENKIFTGRNQMSASEILLKFIQFIGYYFNEKYTIVNSSYRHQNFMPKIQKNSLKYDDDTKFFFKICRDKEDPDQLLIREPFDFTYNPCKTVQKEKLESIKKNFRDMYINILEKGEI